MTYTARVALVRVAAGLCPECGFPPARHGGWGGPDGCTLSDYGVAVRIDAVRRAHIPDTDTGAVGDGDGDGGGERRVCAGCSARGRVPVDECPIAGGVYTTPNGSVS